MRIVSSLIIIMLKLVKSCKKVSSMRKIEKIQKKYYQKWRAKNSFFSAALKKHRPQTEMRTALQTTLPAVQIKYYDQQSSNTAT